jgi:hypothetical protein
MKHFLRLAVVMFGFLALYSCGSVPPPPPEVKAPDMKPIYNAIGKAFMDNQTIEVHIINDKFERSFTSPSDPNLRYSNRYAPIAKKTFQQTVASIKKVFGQYFPNKTITYTAIDYSNLDDYRTNVIQRETGNKLIVLFAISSLDAYSKETGNSSISTTYAYSGIDFYDAKAAAWIAPHGNLVGADKLQNPLFPTEPSESIFQILGRGEETDKDRQGRSVDMFLQSIEPKLADIFTLIGLQPEVATPAKVAPAPAAAPKIVLDPNLVHKWYALDPIKNGTATNMLLFEFRADGKAAQMGGDLSDSWKTQGNELTVIQSSVLSVKYTYSISGNALTIDSKDSAFGDAGYHKVLYCDAN